MGVNVSVIDVPKFYSHSVDTRKTRGVCINRSYNRHCSMLQRQPTILIPRTKRECIELRVGETLQLGIPII